MSRSGEMRLKRGAVAFLESIYANIGKPQQAWLDELRASSLHLFEGVIESGLAWEFSFDGSEKYHTRGISAEAGFRASYHLSQALFPKALWKRGHLGGPVPTLLGCLGGDATHPAYRALNALGVWEMAGSVGLDPCGQGVVVAFFRPKPGELSTNVRHALERIAAHLARAVRLRNTPTVEEAVLGAGGELLHAEGAARDPVNIVALREAARRIDRSRVHRTSDEERAEALELWTALVEGKWSLVERFESDGRRILVARRNDPTMHVARVLSEIERKIVALLCVGHSQKLISYELGFSEGTISKHASRGMAKLGVKSRNELIELLGPIVRQRDGVFPS